MADHEVKKSMQRNTEKRQQPEAVTDQPNAHAMNDGKQGLVAFSFLETYVMAFITPVIMAF